MLILLCWETSGQITLDFPHSEKIHLSGAHTYIYIYMYMLLCIFYFGKLWWYADMLLSRCLFLMSCMRRTNFRFVNCPDGRVCKFWCPNTQHCILYWHEGHRMYFVYLKVYCHSSSKYEPWIIFFSVDLILALSSGNEEERKVQ